MQSRATLALLVLALSLFAPATMDAASAEQRCLAQNIYAEAKNTTVADQTAVGFVTVNRVKSADYPKTICGVVHQKNQFSWTARPLKISDDRAYRDADTLASLIIEEQVPDVSRGAVSFHEARVHPAWAKRMDVTLRTRVHVYYRKR
jgi:spore germination cell wall hydrolase CwlJ-like protein